MDGWLLASPYSSYGSPAVPYREASGSYGRRAVNLWLSTVTAQHAALLANLGPWPQKFNAPQQKWTANWSSVSSP